VSHLGDYQDEMPRRHDLDDDTIEALFAGRMPAGEELGSLVGFVEETRSAARGPAPVPSPQLAAVFAEGLSTDKRDLPATAASNVTGPAPQVAGLPKWRRRKMAIPQFLAGLGLAAKAALATGVAAASVTAAGAAGVLPEPAQNAVSGVVRAATPFEFPDKASDKADHGKRVSTDANDGTPGVDGQQVSDDAKQQGADASQNGLDRANQTPAAGHAPTAVPAPVTPATPARPASAGAPSSSAPQGQPSSPGSQSQTGTDTANSTPATGHAPSSVPPAHPSGRP